MDYINTTEFRTKSSQLIEALKKGDSIYLIHRSKVVGEIKPKKEAKVISVKDIKEIRKLAQELNLPKLSYRERERRYQKHLAKKYG